MPVTDGNLAAEAVFPWISTMLRKIQITVIAVADVIATSVVQFVKRQIAHAKVKTANAAVTKKSRASALLLF